MTPLDDAPTSYPPRNAALNTFWADPETPSGMCHVRGPDGTIWTTVEAEVARGRGVDVPKPVPEVGDAAVITEGANAGQTVVVLAIDGQFAWARIGLGARITLDLSNLRSVGPAGPGARLDGIPAGEQVVESKVFVSRTGDTFRIHGPNGRCIAGLRTEEELRSCAFPVPPEQVAP